jgi:RNA-binding protein 39
MGWDSKLSDDVIQERARNGAAVTHIAVDCHSPQGNVYVKCDSVAEALLAVNALHGRLFDGRVLAVNYVPTDVYHSLFPGAVNATAASVVRN